MPLRTYSTPPDGHFWRAVRIFDYAYFQPNKISSDIFRHPVARLYRSRTAAEAALNQYIESDYSVRLARGGVSRVEKDGMIAIVPVTEKAMISMPFIDIFGMAFFNECGGGIRGLAFSQEQAIQFQREAGAELSAFQEEQRKKELDRVGMRIGRAPIFYSTAAGSSTSGSYTWR